MSVRPILPAWPRVLRDRSRFVRSRRGGGLWLLRVLVLAPLVLAGSAHANDDGGTQSPFALGTGSREQAMGRVGVALAERSEALFWNPARLTAIQWSELSLFRSKLFVDGSVYHAGFLSYPTLDFGTFGVGYQRIGVSDIERRDDRNRFLGTFDNGETNLLLGYGRRFGRFVSLGGNLRIAQQSVDGSSDTGIGVDLGVGLERPFGSEGRHVVSFGANIQNAIEPQLRLLQDDVPDPRNVKLGVGYRGRSPSDVLGWALAMDLDLPRLAGTRVGLGGEVDWRRTLALRLGLDHTRPTFGVGLNYRNVRFDYALGDEELSRNDRFTFAVYFGASLQDRRQERLRLQQAQVTARLEQLLASREQQERERAMQRADAAYNRRDYDEALRHYLRVLALDPDNVKARGRADAIEVAQQLLRAHRLMESGRYAEAVSAYQSVLDRHPQEERAAEGLRLARQKLQQSTDRERTLRDLFKTALEHYTAGQLTRAEASLDELLRLEPRHELGLELRQRVRTARAERGENALREAKRLAAAKRWDGALENLRTAKQWLGTRADLMNLEREWLDARRTALERARIARNKRTEDAAPKPPKRRRLSSEELRELQRKYQEGMAAFSRGDFERATRNWQAVWLDDPSYRSVSTYLVKAYLFEGVELYGKGRYDEALDRCRRVLEIDPDNEKAKRYLDRIQEEKAEVEAIGKGTR